MTALHVWVEGQVQGVFFRDSTRQHADQLGLKGWVKNLPDGRVEALFVGDKSACEKVLDYVKEGPPLATVERVKHEWAEMPGGEVPSRFEIRL